jgi:peptidoglycan/xylan/chitin deacetylase (PgdA/CDA1 family)
MSKAFGEQNPTEGETAVSWQTFTNGSAVIPDVVGDVDWGKLKLDLLGQEGRSAVYDLGAAATRKFTLTENRYGSGAESATIQIRGDTSSFLQDDGLPAWETYTTPVSKGYRYVQARAIVYDEFTDGFGINGALGAEWTGSTWAVSGGKAINTPTLGVERLSNVEFTTNADGWGAGDGSTITRRDYATAPNIDPTGGADEYGLEVATGGSVGSQGTQNITSVVGQWYRIFTRVYTPSANTFGTSGGLGAGNIFSNDGFYRVDSEDSWLSLISSGRSTLAANGIILRCVSDQVGDLAHFDAVSAKQVYMPDMFAVVGNCSPNVDVSVKITRPNRAAAGIVVCLDNPAAPINYIIGYIAPSGNAVLDKYVNGTYTNLIDTGVSYVANAAIRIVKSGTSVDLYYNGAQVGATQTISDASIINNTHHGIMSTDPTVTMDDFSVDKKISGLGAAPPTGLSVTMPQYLTGYSAVMFTFDDANDVIYDNALSILTAKRGVGTYYVRTNDVGGGGKVTWAELVTMQTAGWVIANHSIDDTDLTSLSEEDAVTYIDTAEAALNAQGLTGHHHLAYPGGQYNGTVISAANTAGMITGRTIDGGNIDLEAGFNLFTIKMTRGFVSTDTMETMKNDVNKALTDKTVCLFVIHTVNAGGNITPADLTELVDYIADRYIPMITIVDLYNAMSGEITVPAGP